ncbi:MAG: CHASE domain-containing protein [Candidatus Scalindua sp.]
MKSTKFATFRQLYIPIVVTICIGLCLSLLAFFYVRNREYRSIEADFNLAAWNRINSIKREVEENLQVLWFVYSLYKSSSFVTREEFQIFCKSTLSHHPDIQALEWIPRVPHSQRKDYEQNAQIDGYPDFQITKREVQGKMVMADESMEYFPVYYMEPYKGNETVLGFDLATNPACLETLNKSRDTGEMAATSRITLVQEKGNQYGFLVFIPVYNNQALIDTVEKRRENLTGFVSGVFQIGDTIEASLRYLGKGIDIYLYDKSSHQDEQFIYKYLSQSEHDIGQKIDQLEIEHNDTLSVSHTFDVADRKWLIVCKPAPEYIESRTTWYPWEFLLGGLLLTGVFAVYLQSRIHKIIHIEQLMTDLSSEITERKHIEETLHQSVRELSALNKMSQQVSSSLSLDQVVQTALDGIIAAINPDLTLFFLRDGDNLNLQGVAPPNSKYSHGETPVHRVGECLCGLAVSEGKPIYSSDILNDPRCTWEECKKAGLRSFAALPLFSGDEIIGVLGIASGTQRIFEEQNAFLQTLSSDISTGLQNALLHMQVQRHAEELETKVEERTAELIEINIILEKANTRLKELDQLKSMFIASMSHELRTPLNSIIGFTGIILQGMDGEINSQQNDHLGRVNRSAKHLLSLINDIIDLSKVEAGKVDVFPEDIALDEVVNEAVESVRLQANEKGLALDVSVPKGVRMNTDRKRLYQCILNYLSNAVKFTESGTISITAHDTNGEVEIIVSDTGIGISRQDQQRLFKPFVRIDSHLRAKTLGTGLGLYLTRKLTTELLGGTVGVQSQPGKGSTFTLRLPKEIKQG